MNKQSKIGVITASTVVIANMVGTGIFTSLGFQVTDIQSGFSIIVLWMLGGIAALCGAFSYGELGAAMPRSGGEYHLLSSIYSPFIGFLAGWVSLAIGFSAPIAASAIAMGEYLSRFLTDVQVIDLANRRVIMLCIAAGMVLVITFIHSLRIHFISYFQRFFTFLKVILILVLIVCGFWLAEASNVSFEPTMKAFDSLLSLPFAVALVFVMYSYSGWNASVYIVGEIKKPGKNLPRSLFIGTAMVMVLYILLNSVFLYSTPISEMQGQEEVGYIAARHIFGEQGGMIMGLLISIGLISAISAMIWAGPRVSMVIGEDMSIFRFFVRKNRNGIPIVGLWIQCIVVLILTLTFSFENIVIYTGLILTFFSFLTVLGVIILRIKQPGLERPYKTWGYPYTTIFFLIVTGWMMFFLIKERVEHSVAVVLTIAAGIILFFINRMIEKSKRRPEN